MTKRKHHPTEEHPNDLKMLVDEPEPPTVPPPKPPTVPPPKPPVVEPPKPPVVPPPPPPPPPPPTPKKTIKLNEDLQVTFKLLQKQFDEFFEKKTLGPADCEKLKEMQTGMDKIILIIEFYKRLCNDLVATIDFLNQSEILSDYKLKSN